MALGLGAQEAIHERTVDVVHISGFAVAVRSGGSRDRARALHIEKQETA
jgi:hypothetical protein